MGESVCGLNFWVAGDILAIENEARIAGRGPAAAKAPKAALATRAARIAARRAAAAAKESHGHQ